MTSLIYNTTTKRITERDPERHILRVYAPNDPDYSEAFRRVWREPNAKMVNPSGGYRFFDSQST